MEKIKYGLTDEQVRISKEKHGDNRLAEIKGEGFWSKLKDNFGDPMIKILIVALIINVIFTFMGKAEWYESAGIAIAVLLATFVSTFSEYRNENAFQKLQEEASKIMCNVYRNGQIVEVSVDDIVVGDCILLQSGDKIPADGTLINGSIQVDQSVLNGESKEANKNVKPEDYVDSNKNMDFLNEYKIFRGTVVCSGKGIMKAETIGNNSVYGGIAAGLQEDDERDSPLKVKLTGLANAISKFGYIGGIAIAIAFLFQKIVIANGFDFAQIALYCSDISTVLNNIVEAVILAVIIIVMAVPEGLPLMIAIVSALNMSKMLKDNVLVRKIAGIETAGSLNILFSDKTGTITKGKLEVVRFISGDGQEYASFADVKDGIGEMLSLSIHKNTDSLISGEGKDAKVLGGNATERAILNYAMSSGSFGNSEKTEVVNAIPFNSTNKYSATQISGIHNVTLIKGAPEKIIERCGTYFSKDGSKSDFTDKESINNKINELASRAIRVLAFAVSDQALEQDSLPGDNWTFVGLIGIRDEVRPESVTAISEVQNAGVQVVMITGDRQDTALAIAKEAGIIKNDSEIALTSDELCEMSDEEIKKIMPQIRVISRALPSDKSRLVRLAQEQNLVVGMTGDGVNDSLALKKADVGFAMGSGTEVAKEASDIVILDDNFSSIDKAILYGRTIFNSIRKFVVFQLTINVSAVLISFVCPLIGLDNPLTIVQMLWINLVMDTLAALAFGGEPALRRFMKEKPKSRSESIVSKEMASQIGVGSAWTFMLSLFVLFSAFSHNIFRKGSAGSEEMYLLTGYFALFIFSAVFNAFNARTDKINLFDNIGQNKNFLIVMLIIVVVQVVMTYIGGAVLRCYGLQLNEWIFVLGLAISIIPVDMIRKLVTRKK